MAGSLLALGWKLVGHLADADDDGDDGDDGDCGGDGDDDDDADAADDAGDDDDDGDENDDHVDEDDDNDDDDDDAYERRQPPVLCMQRFPSYVTHCRSTYLGKKAVLSPTRKNKPGTKCRASPCRAYPESVQACVTGSLILFASIFP